MNKRRDEGKGKNGTLLVLLALELATQITVFENFKNQEEENETESIRALARTWFMMKFWQAFNICNNQQVTQLVNESINEEHNL